MLNSSDAISQKLALFLGIGVFSWQVVMGVYRMPVLSGYLLVSKNENLKRWKQTNIFNVFLWVILICIAIFRI